jgi:non-specific protein-tyrosine kinase
MGKFSKALEKAGKEEVVRPVERPAPERIKPTRKKNLPVIEEPAGQMDQHPLAAQPDQPHAAEHPRQPAPSAPGSTADDAVPVVEPLIEPKLTHPSEKRPVYEDSPLKEDPPKPSLESSVATGTHANRRLDGATIALIKPDPSAPEHREEAVDRGLHRSDAGRPSSGKTVHVNYSRTKVQVNDPEILRNNRIFSVFDDMETTDQIKILRTQVLRKLKAIGGNSILITSANPYEGKTFTSINLGVSIAKEFDRTVLIIDADLRKPTQQHTSFSTEFFTLNVERGLTDYLEGDADISEILINPGIEKLTLIPAGVPVDNSPELLNSNRMQEMIFEIKNRYPADRVVIVDGPAVLPFPDAMILARYVDGVILVTESERTSSQDLKKMMLRLKEANIIGTVLNKSRG